ncbi:hypothetical protein LTR91_009643 [Friedmanniomyces endolithicus]|uniref:F-box domain-containing protein n=1 Tax=Friedmanniomyces endolithicus TaxID=329885 RepID=A0AAN6KL17_9PEZI|nr:hypothetical protein LTR35_006782 [Friedmanniomyces endolithicus]KAK0296955.1 hypothetical protein LTS00_004233 [Friedmanniomyces endolithicus]KAK0907322.1 hypothetical protein LTR57_017348 [Friedmanniomyces endolithicus]KAK0983703.1 hypothetical protein LTS01_010971 [Friedmanniomyces endolithicus]KAK0988089.1 hypothetical protein LTR91_009643 [Friedmanniomyces endolithicus]
MASFEISQSGEDTDALSSDMSGDGVSMAELAMINDLASLHIAQTTNPCSLLALPKELREQIFNYAILEDPLTVISITEDGPKQPCLLRVCHQVRRETLTRYYTNNKVGIVISDFDARAVLPSYRLQHKYFDPSKNADARRAAVGCVGLQIKFSPEWNYMMGWCSLEYRGRLHSARESDGHAPVEVLVMSLHTTLDGLREKGMLWMHAVFSLEGYDYRTAFPEARCSD